MNPNDLLKMRRKPQAPATAAPAADENGVLNIGKAPNIPNPPPPPAPAAGPAHYAEGFAAIAAEVAQKDPPAAPLQTEWETQSARDTETGMGVSIATRSAVVEGIPVEQLQVVISDSGLNKEDADSLLNAFAPMMKETRNLMNIARAINVTEETDKRGMKLARETRLQFREIRIAGDKLRKKLNEDSDRRKKAVQGVFHVLEYMITPLEEKLQEQEDFAERAAAVRLEALRKDRVEKLSKYEVRFADEFALANMAEEEFQTFLNGCKLGWEDAQQRKAKEEQDKKDREAKEAADREALRLENERLKKEADERMAEDKRRREAEDKLANERAKEVAARVTREAKLDQDRRALLRPYRSTGLEYLGLGQRTDEDFAKLLAEEKASKEKRDSERAAEEKAQKKRNDALAEERRQNDEWLKKEKDAREKAERDLLDQKKKAAADALAKQKADAKAARAPDATKLRELANTLRKLPMPVMKTNEGTLIMSTLTGWFSDLAEEIEKKADAL